jgi:hypothetical protein
MFNSSGPEYTTDSDGADVNLPQHPPPHEDLPVPDPREYPRDYAADPDSCILEENPRRYQQEESDRIAGASGSKKTTRRHRSFNETMELIKKYPIKSKILPPRKTSITTDDIGS